ncbi:MAG: NAD(P)-dependent oxidoreductase [Candidatus Thermoplasmatota archaeon]|nr:NAD(P)-dependent oxidoreductase [Candidatus Thermoplasmatota archaeon]MCL6002288.1 NAD(P)-dependent oxidoreductase [Candidatus Thermoplasmatota archaeon]
MKVLVTGGEGFIGRYIHRQLNLDGHDTATLDIVGSKGRNHYVTDATRYPDLKRVLELSEPDVLVHLAALTGSNGKGGGAESVKQTYDYLRVNVNAALNVYEACRRLDIARVLGMGSFSPYGHAPCPINEETPFHPNNPYGSSKAFVEEIAKLYSDIYGIKTVMFRPPLVSGEGQKEMNVLREFVSAALNDKPIVILGDGKHIREFIHPIDVATAFSLGLNHLRTMSATYDVFVLGNKPISVIDLANLVVKKVGKGSIEFREANTQAFDQYSDHRKIVSVLGWSPRISVEEIVSRVISDAISSQQISPLPNPME